MSHELRIVLKKMYFLYRNPGTNIIILQAVMRTLKMSKTREKKLSFHSLGPFNRITYGIRRIFDRISAFPSKTELWNKKIIIVIKYNEKKKHVGRRRTRGVAVPNRFSFGRSSTATHGSEMFEHNMVAYLYV